VGSSDNVVVPINEFEAAMDGALRLARLVGPPILQILSGMLYCLDFKCVDVYRSFDDGISECGLVCNPAILALDPRLDKHYGSQGRKAPALSTMFPCS
jgi:hypothetical protein